MTIRIDSVMLGCLTESQVRRFAKYGLPEMDPVKLKRFRRARHYARLREIAMNIVRRRAKLEPPRGR